MSTSTSAGVAIPASMPMPPAVSAAITSSAPGSPQLTLA